MKPFVLIRLTLPILLLSAALLVVGAATGWYIHNHQLSDSEFLRKCVSSVRAAEELEIRTREMRTRLNQYVVTSDEKYLRVIPEMYEQTIEWLENAERLATEPNERELTTKLRHGFERFHDSYRALPLNVSETDESRANLKSLVSRLIDEKLTSGVLLPVHEYLDANQLLISQTIPTNQESADRVGIGLLALGICGAAAGMLAGVAFANHVNQALIQLTVPIRDAAGKLNDVVGPVNLSLQGGNLAEMNVALRNMAEHIGKVVEQLQQSQRETLRAEQLAAVGQLAAGMAHELRNPLTAIKMIVQAAARQGPAGKIHGEDLAVLYEQILRQERSIQSFLDFARPPKIELQPVEFVEIAQRCLQLVTAQAANVRVTLASQLPPPPVFLQGDAEQLRQVVLNLLTNALDAMPNGGQLSVELRLLTMAQIATATPFNPESFRQQSGRWCLLTVTDTGVGLPPDLGERIFEPFVSSKETGLGLGLSICKRIVERHQGQIAARNAPERGAQFLICLPLLEASK